MPTNGNGRFQYREGAEEVEKIEVVAEGVRITFLSGERKFVGVVWHFIEGGLN